MLLLTKASDVETNPGPTTLNKKVWICDICHKQIHVRKQISIRCNRIEHWVHYIAPIAQLVSALDLVTSSVQVEGSILTAGKRLSLKNLNVIIRAIN